jgi:DedD protein
MAEPADLNLDELRRRGRRRLIGAIVLALVAAVVVPMLLESDPRPLGEDVSVRIPPVDDGKFVNKLSPPPKSDPAKSAPAPAATALPPAPASPAPTSDATPRKSVAEAEESGRDASDAGARGPEAKAPPKSPEPANVTDASAAIEPPREGSSCSSPRSRTTRAPTRSRTSSSARVSPRTTESISTSRGTLWRVRVGGYRRATRPASRATS